jgi:predicted nucleic acid-binding Zn ribbon protein
MVKSAKRRRAGGRYSRNEPLPLNQALGELARALAGSRGSLLVSIAACWEEAVGDAVAPHVKPVRIEGDALVVAVDHPAWSTQVRQLEAVILDGIGSRLGPGEETEKPKRIVVHVTR